MEIKNVEKKLFILLPLLVRQQKWDDNCLPMKLNK